MSSQDARLAAGISYIARGWHVFVLSPSKTPVANCAPCRVGHTTPVQMDACACLCCHGFHAATADPGRLAQMFRLHPRGLLAVRSGAPSGTVVIDVDPPGIGTMRILVRNGVLPRTLAAVTGRGGFHLVYAHPGGKIMSGAGKGGPGVDVKADGGYVVAPPSVHPATRCPYRWLGSPDGELTPLPAFWTQRLRETACGGPPGPGGQHHAARPRRVRAGGATRSSSRRSWPPGRGPGTSRCTWPRGTSGSWSPAACSRRTGPRPCCARRRADRASCCRGAPDGRVRVPRRRTVPERRCCVTGTAAEGENQAAGKRAARGRQSGSGCMPWPWAVQAAPGLAVALPGARRAALQV